MSLVSILTIIFGVYALLLIIVGVIGNSFNLYIILKTDLKNTTTFVFFAFLAITDMCSLFFWNLDHCLWIFLINIINSNKAWCKIGNFFQHTFCESSAFFLVNKII